MIRRYLPKNTEQLIHWYERYVSPLSLIAGFLLDNFVLLHRVDVIAGNILLLSYLLISGVGIVFLNLVEAGRIGRKWLLAIAPFVPVVVQFAFGGLFSGYLSLYSRSAGAALSWLFVVALAVLLLGNERFRKQYSKLAFQVSIYFTALFSFLIFFLPLTIKRIGPEMFLLSGAVSACLIVLFVLLLRRLVPERCAPARAALVRSIVIIYVVFNVLYFANLIPPLPLALKSGGVYHAVERVGDVYHLRGEHESWYVKYFNYPATYRYVSGERVYVFSAVFAPTGLSTAVRHQWQRYDESRKRWVTESDVKFTIHGGRDGGFRGYSEKGDIREGSWRVNVLTDHGQVIGRVAFTIVSVSVPPVLEEYAR